MRPNAQKAINREKMIIKQRWMCKNCSDITNIKSLEGVCPQCGADMVPFEGSSGDEYSPKQMKTPEPEPAKQSKPVLIESDFINAKAKKYNVTD